VKFHPKDVESFLPMKRIFLRSIFIGKVYRFYVESRIYLRSSRENNVDVYKSLTCRNADSTSREKLSVYWFVILQLSEMSIFIFQETKMHDVLTEVSHCKPPNLQPSIQPECYICPSHGNSVTPSNKNITEFTCSSRELRCLAGYRTSTCCKFE